MAATDAKPIPFKNTAYRTTFPILDDNNDLVSGATSLDSEISVDGAAFADATAEATEIGSSGMYFLDLTASEMNGDTVTIIVKSTEGNTIPIVLYPEEPGDIRVNVTQIDGVNDSLSTMEANITELHRFVNATDAATGTPTDTIFAGSGSLNAADDFYNGMLIIFTSGTQAGQARRVDDYTGATKTFTLQNALSAAPVAADAFIIMAVELPNVIDDVNTSLITKTIPNLSVGVPPGTPTYAESLGYPYFAQRNKGVHDQNTGKKEFSNNSGTIAYTKATTFIAGVYEEEQAISG